MMASKRDEVPQMCEGPCFLHAFLYEISLSVFAAADLREGERCHRSGVVM